MTERVDCLVIGAGVVGLACGAALAESGREVLVLEQHSLIGSETSSRNSEVIHAGIYYRPGSLKARLCREGKNRLYAYCADRGVGHQRIGKIIVAASEEQAVRLNAINENARANGVNDLAWLAADELRALEPELVGVSALFSPSTGIVDSHGLMLALEGDLATHGGMVVLGAKVEAGTVGSDGITLAIGGDEAIELTAGTVINCAGLHAPAVAARIAGLDSRHVPTAHFAKGHYYQMSSRAPFRHLIYPVPEDGGLGIHLTLDLGGQAKFGPDVRWVHDVDYAFDDSRFDEFIAAIRTYYPAIDPERIQPDYTGIRPKLAGQGAAEQDFRIEGRSVHGVAGLINLFGIESPGLTSALAIADYVTELVNR
ncbi:NAD(P)/FAD-dependent oxidoreductase [Sphingobium algorifonticola]|uniref:NAD(P)/FAD-dependent oxidoreductase n=1 Tax=Sphingobium algorifonticola TaxID=2008318 RepID=A0A437J3R4_9SPHN|nr:NAD(P)/FAD-dependent oxidoreductase [Sphingobium algorifonticola]RVT39153.1 NAD(P)/FAD-dependent oxidoreductase [Sphingobium algorifonticola]